MASDEVAAPPQRSVDPDDRCSQVGSPPDHSAALQSLLDGTFADEPEPDDPALYGRSLAVTEGLMLAYRQLATGLRMLLDAPSGKSGEDQREFSADMAKAAVQQLTTLGVRAIYLHDDIDGAETEGNVAIHKSLRMMAALVDQTLTLHLRSLKEESG